MKRNVLLYDPRREILTEEGKRLALQVKEMYCKLLKPWMRRVKQVRQIESVVLSEIRLQTTLAMVGRYWPSGPVKIRLVRWRPNLPQGGPVTGKGKGRRSARTNDGPSARRKGRVRS
jgi:hypothetical protein